MGITYHHYMHNFKTFLKIFLAIICIDEICKRVPEWKVWLSLKISFSTLRLRQSGRHFADDIFKCIFLNENVWMPIKISMKFVPKGPIHNIPALVQIMAWRRSGDKPLSKPMMVSLLTHIWVIRPQWVNVWQLLLFIVSHLLTWDGGTDSNSPFQ